MSGIEDSGRVRTICPWCSRIFPSQSAWADHFDRRHRVIKAIDRHLPIFNTPSPEARYIDTDSDRDDVPTIGGGER